MTLPNFTNTHAKCWPKHLNAKFWPTVNRYEKRIRRASSLVDLARDGPGLLLPGAGGAGGAPGLRGARRPGGARGGLPDAAARGRVRPAKLR